MNKHDKHFGIAMIVSLLLSTVIAIGATDFVESHANAQTAARSVA